MENGHMVKECKRWFYKTRNLPTTLRESPGIMGDIIKCAFAKRCQEFHGRTEGPIVAKYVGRNIKHLMRDLNKNRYK